jgi:uncharacterized protein YcbK (DUF882 family)
MTNPTMPDTDPRDLGHRQELHTALTAKLIEWANAQPDMHVRLGEAYRSPQVAQLNAQSGAGIAHSLHTIGLAVDLKLFIKGEYQTQPEPYKVLADYWLTLDPLCSAGYYFHSVDADHFSITYQGRM